MLKFLLSSLLLVALGFIAPSAGYAAPAVKAKIVGIKLYDEGSIDADSASIRLDTTNTTCGGADEEPFHDALLGVSLKNDYLSALRVERLTYSVPNYNGLGAKFKSISLSPAGQLEIAAKTTAEIIFAFAYQSAGEKYFAGADSAINSSLGFRNITYKVRARTGNGRVVNLAGSSVMSIGEIDRCP